MAVLAACGPAAAPPAAETSPAATPPPTSAPTTSQAANPSTTAARPTTTTTADPAPTATATAIPPSTAPAVTTSQPTTASAAIPADSDPPIATATTAPTTTAAPASPPTTAAPPATADAPPPTATTTIPADETSTPTAVTAPPPPTTTTAAPPAEPPRNYLPQVVERLPHDRTSFTQGLVWRQGVLYESSGLYGRSAVRIVDPGTGEVLREQALPDEYFGEGLEVSDGRVVQLTWREETAFIWNAETLEPLGTFSYQGEGWGLCAQEDRFVMSDGSPRLTFRHLETFAVLGTVEVTRNGQPTPNLNELECANGLVYANIWLTDSIAVIDPANGTVTALIDGSGLTAQLTDREGIDVLNGIAYRPDLDLFYMTGKLWPNLFLVELVPRP